MNNYYNPNNFGNNMYGNNFFNRTQPFNSVPQTQTQFFPPQSNIQFASIDEAKAYILTPNSQVIFLDKDKQRCYLKTSDSNGQSKLEIYNLQKQDGEVQETSATPVHIDLTDYAKIENLTSLKEEIDVFKGEITERLNEIYKKIDLKNALENINQSMK